ncbi:glycoside hydrolase family 127 protein [Microbulbifer sp. SAOS-129_SWC]|uniref:glycoside hydrolase family 127 protein n=1 Tax=Microbulbifer sp. SAOS-129_SWC TaxID=3145235 RepID=UPI0032163041
MKRILSALALCSVAGIAAASAAAAQPGAPVEAFPLSDVRLLDSPFKHAQDTNIGYILSLDPDRLLAPFLREAGLKPKAENYGNWENTGLDGHIGGHYLSALSLAYAATGDRAVLERLHYMLDELQRAQKANGNGYIGGIPGGAKMWQQISAGEISADLFTLNQKWVPLYNIHKLFSGLRDAYRYVRIEQAKTMLVQLSDWGVHLFGKLSDEQIQDMLRSEHGGLNEVYADVAEITGDDKYLLLARRLSHRAILNPLEHHQDKLTGLHANTQIPKVIGYERVGQLSGDKAWQDAAEYFWTDVVEHRTVAIGGNSVREHFHSRRDFSSMIEDVEGPETCNTYNMLKLTRLLYLAHPQTRYIRYYERALYNHILSSQNPDTGGLVYFTPMRPQHYRVYSQAQKDMWCCVGTGIENHSKYGAMIYAHRGDNLFVNLFIPSTLKWEEKHLTLSQRNRIPDNESTSITLDRDADFTLQLRYPRWVAQGALAIRINGKPYQFESKPGSYIPIKRHWKAGDHIEVALPMHPEMEQMPDGSDYFALLYGPVVLAAKTQPFAHEKLNYFADASRMGHIPSGRMCPLDQSPVFVSDNHNFLQELKRLPGNQLRFAAPKELQTSSHNKQHDNLELIPFFRLHESRYMVYWPVETPEQLAQHKQEYAEADAARLALAAETVDTIAPGEQQPEADHFFAGKETEAGIHNGRHWRHSRDWFGYQLKDPKQEAKTLRITYYGLDAGRTFSILLNGVKLADVTLKGNKGDDFFSVDYPLPPQLQNRKAPQLKLRFRAAPGSIAGGIYGIRLLRD